MTLRVTMRRYGFVMSVLVMTGCGASDSPAGGSATSGAGTGTGKPCIASADCGASEVCVTTAGQSACTLTCTASGAECGGTASCSAVGSLSVSVCEKPKPAPSPQDPPRPEEQPRLPCASDAECDGLARGSICATWKGARDCTSACTSDDPCNSPAVGGISSKFLACLVDEGSTSRKACLPREECLQSPATCVTFPGGAGGGDPGFDAGSP